MAISFAYYDGSLMKGLGKCGAVVANQTASLSTQLTALTSLTTGVVGQIEAEPDVQAITGAGYISALQGASQALPQLMRQQAAALVNRAVYRDSPRVGQTLTSSNTLASLQEILRQFTDQGQSFLRQTVSAPTLTKMGGRGDAVVLCSTNRPFDGRSMELAFAETVTALCTADSFTGGSVAYQEQYRITGEGQQADPFAFDWPAGSGATLLTSACDGVRSATGGNLLTNSGFDTWASGVPTGWELVTGVAGTNIIQDSGNVLRGASALKIVGDSLGTLTRLRRTVTGLTPLTQYGCVAWMQLSSASGGAGQLTLSLTDSGGTVLQDPAGAPCSLTIDLTTVPTLYEPYGAAFRTPLVIPSAVYFDIRLTTPRTDGLSNLLDVVSLTPMAQHYVHGPSYSVHSGGAAPQTNDAATLAVTNSRGAGGTLNTWQVLMYRTFPEVQSAEILFPSLPGPSVLDAWIS